MKASEIRKVFLDFFNEKKHKIVASAPIVNKGDPTLMFTNAGMNQFKDFFLGNRVPEVRRVADTQKCLRVSGKHNDLEEVGRDSYHHTMFEMLGNWSFGEYFKEEAINWAWELLIEKYGLDPERLYATVFGGDVNDGLEADNEAVKFWNKWLPEDRILYFDRKDNFWEMGDTGPCGPCSELHYDVRTEKERMQVDGVDLVNMDHPQLIEIWNLVFIQFNRKANGQLEELPEKHVDTGMGFERLVMVLQGKQSSYDSDIFTPFIKFIEKETNKTYKGSYEDGAMTDIAFRVIVDHLRAVAFTIADGELPSNTGAGYVIRRILRRAVRYYFSFLDIKEPFLHKMMPLLVENFGDVFPEIKAQQSFVTKVILEEERSFLRTLELGLKRFSPEMAEDGVISGKEAFELYDTYGFPIDLTRLIAEENDLRIDEKEFEKELKQQKERSRADASKKVGDWYVVNESKEVEFLGYDELEVKDTLINRYRIVDNKKGKQYQVVLNRTPFYAEGGGQVGDTGLLISGTEEIQVLDTQKENDLILHYVKTLPTQVELPLVAKVDKKRRRETENNHSATHLLHAALRQVLGDHVKQRGSLVKNDYLRFDFSHFEKVSDSDLANVEKIVNKKIRENIPLDEQRSVPIETAKSAGAMMLFGEKYGDHVRMITFDNNYSVELCGGCHVPYTGVIGLLKITSESAVAAGVRRIEAITAEKAEGFINDNLQELAAIKEAVKAPQHVLKSVVALQDENKNLKRELDRLQTQQAGSIKEDLKGKVQQIGEINFVGQELNITDTKALKTLAYQLEKELGNSVITFGIKKDGKAQLMVTISQNLTESTNLHAGNMVREIAKEINGGGGGQAFFATAGGSNPNGIESALARAKEMVEKS